MFGFYEWIDRRYPISRFWEEHMAGYYAPKNFNFWYYFGSLALMVLVIQILTGIFLTMHYKPDANLAFCVGGIHHAGCPLGMVDSLHAFDRRIGTLYRGSICTCSGA